VRHIPQGSTWHPATDALRGTDVYGCPNLQQAFSVKWDTYDYNQVLQSSISIINPSSLFQFLFSSGDQKTWLIVDKSEIIGDTGDKFYTREDIPIIASSVSCEPYSALWYSREGKAADPWVSVRDHRDSDGELMVYGEASSSGHNTALQTSRGMNVYIRKMGTK
jgi:hypothetical protein